MSLIQKRREQEKLRQNGLNDSAANTRRPSDYNSWPQEQSSFPYYAPSSTPRASRNVQQGQPRVDYMKSLMQQADLHSRKLPSKRSETIPSWSVPTETSFTMQNAGEPVILDNNLQPGCYYDENPVYFDPETGKTLTLSSLESTTSGDAVIAQTSTPAPIDASASGSMQQGQCINPNCVSCKPAK